MQLEQNDSILSNPINSTLDLKDFEKNFKWFSELTACQVVMDKDTYMKHLKHESAHGVAEASAQLDSLQYFSTLLHKQNRVISELNLLGHNRITNICEAIINLKTLPIPRIYKWQICALSCVPSNCLLDLSVEYAIDESFEPFATALWTADHMQRIEKNRMYELALSMSALSKPEIVQSLISEEEIKSNAQVYIWAYKTSNQVLTHTLERLNHQPTKEIEGYAMTPN